MFKPLLRTLPTLTGNFTIACKLREYTKEDSNTYSTYVRLANIIPLQNYMTNRNIEINLLNGKYEHDITKYHYYYSNVFYKENFNYSKNNYVILDLESIYNYNNDARNKDYEFGCKRIQYSQHGSQFNFYAPIYIDNVNDLPEYFKININLNNKITKEIKIYVNKDNKKNYLKNYLTRYLKQIDERVIFCLYDSLQATYFGIDVKNGGIAEYKDNVIGSLYKNQTTINKFDYTICKGFERNNLIMRQIIPLSFSFNLNDIFNNYETDFFSGVKLQIYGHYYTKNNNIYDMYDFDINYTNSSYKFNKYNDYSGLYDFVYGKDSLGNQINIMNIGYPALNEGKYTKYLYTNKITPSYCKFKMLYSDDNNPYITNINYAYSFNQYPNEKFGSFPTMFKGIYPNGVIDNNDFKLPIGNSLYKYYKTIEYYGNSITKNTINFDKYSKLMNNYYSSWYNINEYCPDFDNEEYVEKLFTNNKLWSDVKYDYTYHKGILYSFKNLHKYNIHKFGVFCGVKMNYINEENLNTTMIRANNVISAFIDKNDNKVFNYNDSINMEKSLTLILNNAVDNAGKTEDKIDDKDKINFVYYKSLYNTALTNINPSQIKYNQIMIEDERGNYIEEKHYIEENTFFKLTDIYDLISTQLKSVIINKQEKDTLLINIENTFDSLPTIETCYETLFGTNEVKNEVNSFDRNDINNEKDLHKLIEVVLYKLTSPPDGSDLENILNMSNENGIYAAIYNAYIHTVSPQDLLNPIELQLKSIQTCINDNTDYDIDNYIDNLTNSYVVRNYICKLAIVLLNNNYDELDRSTYEDESNEDESNAQIQHKIIKNKIYKGISIELIRKYKNILNTTNIQIKKYLDMLYLILYNESERNDVENPIKYKIMNDMEQIYSSLKAQIDLLILNIYNNIIKEINLKLIVGHELLNSYNNINFFEYKNGKLQFSLLDKVYNTNKNLIRFNWLKDNLYYTNQSSNSKKLVSEIWDQIDHNENIYGKLCFFIKNSFIKNSDIIDILNSLSNNLFISYTEEDDDNNRGLTGINSLLNNIKDNIDILSPYKHNIYNYVKYKIGDTTSEYIIESNGLSHNSNYIYDNTSDKYKKFNNYFLDDVNKEYNYNDSRILSAQNLYDNFLNNCIKDINNFKYSILNELTSIDKYQYKFKGNVNGIDIINYFTQQEQITKPIYVDTYNLNNFIKQYNEKENDNIKLFDKDKMYFYEYFIKVINKTHLLEYCKKLCNNINNVNEYKFYDINLLDLIYVKQRYWVIDKNKVDNTDKYVSLYNFINNIIPYSKVNNLIKGKTYYTSDTGEGKFICKFTAKYDKYYYEIIGDVYTSLKEYVDYLHDLHTYNDDEIIEFLSTILSDERLTNTNCFKLTLGYDEKNKKPIEFDIDLCVKKEVVKLNNDLRKLIDKNYFLYLYIKDTCISDNLSAWDIISETDMNKNNEIYKNIDEFLIPLFNNVYINKNDLNTIHSMYKGNKINSNNEYVISYDKYFKEINRDALINICIGTYSKNTAKSQYIYSLLGISNDIQNKWKEYCLINEIYEENIIDDESYKNYIYTLLDFININYEDEYYHICYNLFTHNGIKLYSIYNVIDCKYDNIKLNSKLYYDDELHMYIYNYNGVNYGFYWISLEFDNTNNSFNILNDYNLNVAFYSIDNHKINDKGFDKYLSKIFYKLDPFLKLNIFNSFTINAKNILYPYEIELNINYINSLLTNDNEINKYKILQDNSSDKLYNDIIQFSKPKKIKLLRYLNYITPYIKKTNIINDCYELKFIDKDNKYKSTKKYNIFTKENINIYNYNGIKLYDGVYSNANYSFIKNGISDNYDILQQYEYKHFNDNLLYNLPEEISIIDKKKYTYEEINEFKENKDLIQDYKIKILLNYFKKNNLDYQDIILFLFNKYDSTIVIEPIKLHTLAFNNLYRVKYKFNLI